MIRFGFGLLLIVFAVGARSAEPVKLAVKTETVELPDAVAQELRQEFTTEAFTIRDGDTAVLTLWFRTEIPAHATADQIRNGLTYHEIPEGTLVGVVKFEKPFVDFRKQEIPVGSYTLRIAVQPDTGDHKDTAPHTDFLLLCPANEDKTVEPLELKELVKRSIKSTGGDHPGVLLLFPNFGKETDAKLAARPDGVTCLQLKRTLKADGASVPFGFAIAIAGVSKKR